MLPISKKNGKKFLLVLSLLGSGIKAAEAASASGQASGDGADGRSAPIEYGNGMFPSIFRGVVRGVCNDFTKSLVKSTRDFDKGGQLNSLWRKQFKSFDDACIEDQLFFDEFDTVMDVSFFVTGLKFGPLKPAFGGTLAVLFSNAASNIHAELTAQQRGGSVEDRNWTFTVMKRAKESASETSGADESLVSFFNDKISQSNLEHSEPFEYYKVLVGWVCTKMSVHYSNPRFQDLPREILPPFLCYVPTSNRFLG